MQGSQFPQFTEMQRETYRGTIGKQRFDQRTYEVLFGDGSDKPAPKPRLLRPATVLPLLTLAGILLSLLPQF